MTETQQQGAIQEIGQSHADVLHATLRRSLDNHLPEEPHEIEQADLEHFTESLADLEALRR